MRADLDDKLWELIKPLLPPERPKAKGGRPRVPDRAVLAGILFVPLGDASPRDGLRQWYDLLAPSSRLAKSTET
jgi:transposase